MNKIKLTLVVISFLSFDCEAKDIWGKIGDALDGAAAAATEFNNAYAASEVVTSANTWKKLQEDYILEMGNVGDCKQIACTLPNAQKPSNRSETGYFSYECSVSKGVARWTAKNKVDLGDCEAGNKWSVSISIDDDGDREISSKTPNVKSCRALTPNFGEY
jgi:hypothetical protein